ncbi:hypothetical protein EC973_005514 [Apophysomyces ossiformis]|uniref:ER-bound oxygenase mpaB/mpaB'/Rubber oxygenase catalytic domain-containing protein n=1 Tax=Apophysomyces ossiformis TaxID=679940 RepID=A0A8H7BHB0_9FUNG|nr:hypothetical protein EC973_005514 [Apophysomyces ossiformis]
MKYSVYQPKKNFHASIIHAEIIYRQALEIALFKTYSVPTISRLLLSTRELVINTSRRAEDTELILSEIIEAYARIQNEKHRNPSLDEQEAFAQYSRPVESARRLNELHGKYNILNDDYLYTLALFIMEPIRWINQYEYRQLDQREINAYFRVWYDVGVGMGIKDIPETVEKLEAFMKNYERTSVVYHPANWKVAEATVKHLLTRLPTFMGPIARKLIPCSLEPHVIDAFRLDRPAWLLKKLFDGTLYLRAFIIRHLFLPRKYYLIRTSFYATKNGKYLPVFCLYKPEYPEGYEISSLGPEKFCPMKHSSSRLA